MMLVMRLRLAICLGIASLLGCNLPTTGGPGLEPPGDDSSGFGNRQGTDQSPTGMISDPINSPPTITDPSDELDEPVGGETSMMAGSGGTSTAPPDNGTAGAMAAAGGSPEPTPPPPPTSGAAGGAGTDGAGQLNTDAGTTVEDGGGPAQGSVSCDLRDVACELEPSPCDGAFEVHQIVNGCYGACVPIEACACNEAAACPDASQYTCISSQMHCTPYLD